MSPAPDPGALPIPTDAVLRNEVMDPLMVGFLTQADAVELFG